LLRAHPLLDDGVISMLPRGVDEYLERRVAALSSPSARPGTDGRVSAPPTSSQELRDARKAVARIDKQLARVTQREARLHAELVEHMADFEKLAALHAQLRDLAAEKGALEEEWLAAASVLDSP